MVIDININIEMNLLINFKMREKDYLVNVEDYHSIFIFLHIIILSIISDCLILSFFILVSIDTIVVSFITVIS